MFLGMQNDLIALTAETKEKLEDISYMNFTEIIETKEKYILFNGQYIKEADALDNEKSLKQKENIEKAKQAIENGYVVFKDAQFETNAQTVGDLTATMLMLQAVQKVSHSELGSESENGKMLNQVQQDNNIYCWLSKDDKIVELSLEDFVTLGVLIAEYKNNIWNTKYIAFKTAIEQAQTIEELNAINIDYEVS